MSDFYEIPANPEYEPNIRKLQNSDPASAEKTFNPLIARLIENTQAVKASTGTQGGMKSVTYVVGTAKSGHTKDDVDFLCTGVNDQDVINEAVKALPSRGGSILLLEGRYFTTGIVQLNKRNITFQGVGASTVFDKQFTGYVLRVSAADCQIRDLIIEGNGETFDETRSNAGVSTGVSAVDFTLENVRITNHGGAGVLIGAGCAKMINCDFSDNNRGISFNAEGADHREQIHIINCTMNDNRGEGIYMNNNPTNCSVESCEAIGNKIGITVEGNEAKAVRIKNCTVSNNKENGIAMVGRCHSIAGSTIMENGGYGALLLVNDSLLAGNILWGNGTDPYMNSGTNNMIDNNIQERRPQINV